MDPVNQALPKNAPADVDRRQRLCPAGEIANSLLDQKRSVDDRARLCRRLIAFGAHLYWGLSYEDIARALGVSKQFVWQDTRPVLSALRLEAARLNFTESQCGLPVESVEENAAV